MDKIAWLSRLVAFDTTSRNSNLDLILCIEEWFKTHQLTYRITYDADHKKANIFATLAAQDGSCDGGIILSGHTDVVPVDGQKWDTDPFVATQIDNKIFGRGTCDMKGFIAVALALVPQFQKRSLPCPVHFAFTYDEEVGCRGAPVLINDLLASGIKPSACIVGEPSLMQPIVAHKGIQVYRCRIHGLAAHSSLTPNACNAIEYGARLISFIRHLANQYKHYGPFDSYFDVPFTSISTNMIHGGIAQNVIPANCEFSFEFRYLPEVKPSSIIDKIAAYAQQELLHEMQTEFANATIEIEKLGAAPCFETTEDAAIRRIASKITGVDAIQKVSYATEAGIFQAANIPTIVCGPGSIEQAHRANEFVSVEQLARCEEFLLKLVQEKEC